MKNIEKVEVILIVTIAILTIVIIGEKIYFHRNNNIEPDNGVEQDNGIEPDNDIEPIETKDSDFEKQMISIAKTFDKGKEAYLTLKDLNLFREGCYDYSGILISKGSYYPNLICDNYRSKTTINNGKKLVGDEIMLLPTGINYIDPKTNKPDSSVLKTEGVYTINYDKLIRKVVVLNNETLKKMYPEIMLKGDEYNYVFLNNSYNDLSVIANDNIDGDLTSKVIKTGNVDTSKIGLYEIIYTVTNSRGYKNYVKREVEVYNLIYEYNEHKEKNSYLINFKFGSDHYKEIQLPNGITTNKKEVSYTISDNGIFEFNIFDDQGIKHNKTIVIRDIDKEKPKLTCMVYLYDNNSKIVVNATDDIGITDYVYNYGDKTSGKMRESSFTYSVKTSDTSVTVYDAVNNSATSKCSVIDSSTKYGRTYSKVSSIYPYWIYIPPTLTKRTSVPLVIFLHGSGERGPNMDDVNRYGFPNFIKEGTDYPFIMIAPQTNSAWAVSRIMQLIDEVTKKYPEIDQRRIVLTGFSMGGNATFKIIRNYPNYFSLAVPVAGSDSYTASFDKTTFRIYFGTDDPNSGLESCKRIIRKTTAANPKSQLIILNGKNHTESAQAAYSDPELIKAIVNTYR